VNQDGQKLCARHVRDNGLAQHHASHRSDDQARGESHDQHGKSLSYDDHLFCDEPLGLLDGVDAQLLGKQPPRGGNAALDDG